MGAPTIDSSTRTAFQTGMQSSSESAGRSGHFKHFTTTETSGTNHTQSTESSYERTEVRNRIAYPLRAVENRLLNSAVLGCILGGLLGFAVSASAASIVGGVAGGIVKLAKMIGGHRSEAHKTGAAIGALTGALVGLPAAIALATVAATAFSVISLVASVIHSPIDIYRAATLDPLELNPDHSVKEEIIKAAKQRMEESNVYQKAHRALRV